MTTTPSRSREATRLAALRAAFAVADRLAPDLAARWALRIWCTLPAERWTTARRAPRDRARPPRCRCPAAAASSSSPGVRASRSTWRTAGAAGAASSARSSPRSWPPDGAWSPSTPPATASPRRGASAPGAAPRWRSPRRSRRSRTIHGTPVAVVAHSLGCTTTALAVRDGLPVGRLALVAPSAGVASMTAGLARALGYGERTGTRFERRLEALAGRPLQRLRPHHDGGAHAHARRPRPPRQGGALRRRRARGRRVAGGAPAHHGVSRAPADPARPGSSSRRSRGSSRPDRRSRPDAPPARRPPRSHAVRHRHPARHRRPAHGGRAPPPLAPSVPR